MGTDFCLLVAGNGVYWATEKPLHIDTNVNDMMYVLSVEYTCQILLEEAVFVYLRD